MDQILTDHRFLEHKTAEVGVVEQTDADGNRTKIRTGACQMHDALDAALRDMGNGSGGRFRSTHFLEGHCHHALRGGQFSIGRPLGPDPPFLRLGAPK